MVQRAGQLGGGHVVLLTPETGGGNSGRQHSGGISGYLHVLTRVHAGEGHLGQIGEIGWGPCYRLQLEISGESRVLAGDIGRTRRPNRGIVVETAGPAVHSDADVRLVLEICEVLQPVGVDSPVVVEARVEYGLVQWGPVPVLAQAVVVHIAAVAAQNQVIVVVGVGRCSRVSAVG